MAIKKITKISLIMCGMLATISLTGCSFLDNILAPKEYDYNSGVTASTNKKDSDFEHAKEIDNVIEIEKQEESDIKTFTIVDRDQTSISFNLPKEWIETTSNGKYGIKSTIDNFMESGGDWICMSFAPQDASQMLYVYILDNTVLETYCENKRIDLDEFTERSNLDREFTTKPEYSSYTAMSGMIEYNVAKVEGYKKRDNVENFASYVRTSTIIDGKRVFFCLYTPQNANNYDVDSTIAQIYDSISNYQ